MKRRVLLSLLGCTAPAWAQAPSKRTVGYLSPRSAEVDAQSLSSFRRGLSETGYVEGRNVTIEYRWADGRYDQLPALATDLVRRQVSVIVTNGGPQPARAVLAATDTIPVVFSSGSDPVADGLVRSFGRPGGNVTGVHVFTTSLGTKRLELLRELVPKAEVIGFLVNPSSQIAEMQVTEVVASGRTFGLKIEVLGASTAAEIDRAFASLAERGAGALLMSADLFFAVQQDQLVALAADHRVPVMYEWPDFVRAGGLMSYAPVRAEAQIQLGNYVGRVLNGAKPADLPIAQPAKFELAINLKTARTLGLTVPQILLAQAEVIE